MRSKIDRSWESMFCNNLFVNSHWMEFSNHLIYSIDSFEDSKIEPGVRAITLLVQMEFLTTCGQVRHDANLMVVLHLEESPRRTIHWLHKPAHAQGHTPDVIYSA